MSEVRKTSWLSSVITGAKALVPVVIKFVPQLAGWASFIYVAFDLVLWVIKHFGL